MRVLLVIACLLLLLVSENINAQTQCPNAPSSPADRRTNKSKLRVATYNAEWLFMTRYNCPGTGCPWTNKVDAEKHMVEVAEELAVIDADIVNLAEVQDCSTLVLLNSILNQKGMNYLPYLLSGTDTATGQNVALLTRVDPVENLQRTSARVAYPVAGSTCDTDLTGTQGVSKMYFTTFNVEGLPNPLSLFGLHFLAFPDREDRCVQREAQATVISNLVANALANGSSVIVLGDLNDFDPSVQDAAGSVAISKTLQILRDPIASRAGDELTNAAGYVSSASNRYTCWWDKDSNCNSAGDELTMIDHVLISNDLTKYVTAANMDHSYGPACNTFESDHWPSIVDLQTTSSSAVLKTQQQSSSSEENNNTATALKNPFTTSRTNPANIPLGPFNQLESGLIIGGSLLFALVVVGTIVAFVYRSSIRRKEERSHLIPSSSSSLYS